MGDFEDDYDDDFYFDDDGYLYVEDSFALAVSRLPIHASSMDADHPIHSG